MITFGHGMTCAPSWSTPGFGQFFVSDESNIQSGWSRTNVAQISSISLLLSFFTIKWAIWICCLYLSLLLSIKTTNQTSFQACGASFFFVFFPKYPINWFIEYQESLWAHESAYLEVYTFPLHSVCTITVSDKVHVCFFRLLNPRLK